MGQQEGRAEAGRPVQRPAALRQRCGDGRFTGEKPGAGDQPWVLELTGLASGLEVECEGNRKQKEASRCLEHLSADPPNRIDE